MTNETTSKQTLYKDDLLIHLITDKAFRVEVKEKGYDCSIFGEVYAAVVQLLIDYPQDDIKASAFGDIIAKYLGEYKKRTIAENIYNQAFYKKANTRYPRKLLIEELFTANKAKAKEDIKETPNKEEALDVIAEAKEEAKASGKPLDVIALSKEIEQIDSNKKDAEIIAKWNTDKLTRQELYEAAPDDIKRLTQLLSIANPGITSTAHFFTALSIAGACMGKKLIGLNNMRRYYCNSWLAILAPTGSNKVLNTIERYLEEVIYENITASPLSVMNDRFTSSSLFSEMGKIVDNKTWASMSEIDRMTRKQEIVKEAKGNKARIVFSDEFGHALAKNINSGADNSSETGNILKLADSGSNISGSTNQNGFRIIADCCVSMVGYTQPDTWYNMFPIEKNLSSGLIGRFFVMNMKDFEPIRIDKLDIAYEQIEIEIKAIFRKWIEKVNLIGGKLTCLFSMENGFDFAGSLFDEVIASPCFQAPINQGILPISDVRGKIIYQAIKMTMLHCFLMLEDKTIKSLDKVDYFALNGCDEIRTDLLKDKEVFKAYVKLFLCNLIKMFLAKESKTEVVILEEKIMKELLTAKDNSISLRVIQQKNWKLNNFPLNSGMIRERLNGLAERGIVKLTEGKKGGLTIKWSGRSYYN